MRLNEDNVISELRKRNPKALDFIIDKYGGLIQSIVKKTLFNFEGSGSVEECMNDVFLAIWNNIDKFYKENSFKSWIAAIAKYKAIDYKRKLLKELYNENLENIEMQQEDTSDKKILEKENHEELMALLSRLKPEDKKIFILRYFNEESTKEIAEKLDVNKEVINNRLSRGRKKLRKLIFSEVNKQ
ncbi:MAG: sigma-70 family RNA polymerase sigma factor [Clostridium sp.]|uniref:sigma-70 family RNA polymerase sigma factor n=1 Tax=Clostridium sp. TaxID=1506 RepID=UPI003D6D333C